jgi:hypothetical protein
MGKHKRSLLLHMSSTLMLVRVCPLFLRSLLPKFSLILRVSSASAILRLIVHVYGAGLLVT